MLNFNLVFYPTLATQNSTCAFFRSGFLWGFLTILDTIEITVLHVQIKIRQIYQIIAIMLGYIYMSNRENLKGDIKIAWIIGLQTYQAIYNNE